jgi:signal transduction histidine kinase/ligand-binding sensor domain-containing protein
MLLAWPSPVSALNPALDISQYAHTSWKIRDAFAKGAITSIAQTPDGYLWVGTELGLLRFDGMRAVPWQPPGEPQLPSNNIRSLLVTRNGTLFIGTDRGLASWKERRLTRYDMLTGSFIFRLLEDREGSIWISRFASTWTLCTIQKDRVQCHGDDGGAGSGALGVYEDSKANLWVGTPTGLWRWQPGPPRFYPLSFEDNGIQGFSEDDDGTLLISQGGAIRRFTNGAAQIAHPFAPSMRPSRASWLLRDHDGSLWIGSSGGGLVHVHQGMTDVFTRIDGLSDNTITALFEDRERNIWVATNGGLDRFRDAAVVSFSVSQGLSNDVVSSVLTPTDGSAWIGTFDGLNRWTHGHITVYGDRSAQTTFRRSPYVSHKLREVPAYGMPAGGVQSIFQDSGGRMWVSTLGGIGYVENDRFVPLRGVPGGLTRAIAEDNRGNIWMANRDAGLVRVPARGGDLARIPWTTLNRDDPVSAMVADPSQGGLWFGFLQGGIVYFADGQVRAAYGAAERLAEGRVSALQVGRDGALWVAASGGLSRLKDGRVVTMTSPNGLPCDAVGWVVEDDAASFWLGMPCGVVRIARDEIDAWVGDSEHGDTDPTRRLQTTVFDNADGVRIPVNVNYYSSPAAKSADGKLWFMSRDGVSVVDPRHLPFNSVPPPVYVEQVIANRKTYEAGASSTGHIQLPALTRDVQIDYTALSLVAPEKNRFRVKLEGWDRDWQEVGNRRQAFYNNLPPRTYRFRVIASNNSGVWNETGAVLDFSVAPAYHQTLWFAALSTTAVIALVWGAHRLRLRIVEKHQQEISALNERLMKAQEQERIRIAGEIHDGVMQDMLAVTMMLGRAKRRSSDESEMKATIDKVQEKLIRTGTELRQLSHDLHPPLLQDAGLPVAVNAYCEQFSTTWGIPVSCDADDSVHELSRGAALALFRILQEALGNAAKHAAPRRIVVRLKRWQDTVSLIVSDDGIGFDGGRLASGGGLGLVMMRERAGQLNGTFDFESTPGRGTTITVVIPFR